MNDPVMQTPSSPPRFSWRFSPGRLGAALALLLIFLAIFSVTVVESGQSAVMIRAGSDQSRVISTPGLYLRIPLIDRVWLIDTRLQTTEQIESQAVTTSDQQSLRLGGWMAWRVTDPVRFQTVAAADKGALDDKLRKTLGEALTVWAKVQPASGLLKSSSGEISKAGLADLNQRLSALGIEAGQAGIRQVGLSDAENEAVYARMSASKNRYTRQLIDGLTADERQLVALQNRQQAQVLEEAYRASQQARQSAEQQLLAAYSRQYGQPNSFAETLRHPSLPAGKSDN